MTASWSVALDRESPSAVPAERSLLGGLLQEAGWLPRVLQVLTPEDFYRPEHAALYRLLSVMHAAAVPIDLVTVASEVAKGQGPERYGGVAYVTELPEHAPSTANLLHYAAMIFEAAQRRRIISIALSLAERAFDQVAEPADLARQAVQDITEAGERSTSVTHTQPADVIVDELIESWRDEEVMAVAPPLPTPFGNLNELLYRGGFGAGQLIVIGGPPKMGKTAFSVGCCTPWAKAGRPVDYNTLEMPRRELLVRAVASDRGIPIADLGTGNLYDDELESVVEWGREHRTLHVTYRPGADFEFIAEEARRLRGTTGLAALVVDHLHLVRHERNRGENAATYIGRTAERFKVLAGELGVPVLLLAQLNREAIKRDAPRRKKQAGQGAPWWEAVPLPRPSDIKESGAIEAVADCVIFPVSAQGYANNGFKLDRDPGDLAALVVAAQRNGPTGVVGCSWQGDRARFVPYGGQA